MFRYAKFATLIAVTLGVLTVGVQALENGNSPGANRIHRRQLVVAEATPFCVEAAGQDTLRIRGLNLGSQAPNVALALIPLVVVSGPVTVAGDVTGLQETVTMLPDAFCDNPASDLLTVMRAKTRWARSRRALATFEVTIVGAGEIPADLVDQVNQNTDALGDNTGAIAANAADIGTNTASIGANTAAIGVNGSSIGANSGALGAATAAIGVNASAIGANGSAIGVNTAASGGNAVAIASNGTNIVANAEAIAALGGGGGLSSEVHWYPTVNCNALVPALNQGWDTDNTLQAVAGCANPGTDILNGDLTYSDASGRRDARLHLVLPADQSGAIDLRTFWSANTNAGDIEWLISTVCLGDDEPITPTFNAQQTVVDAAGSANGNLMIAGLGAVTQTGCAPGEVLVIDVARDCGRPARTGGHDQPLGTNRGWKREVRFTRRALSTCGAQRRSTHRARLAGLASTNGAGVSPPLLARVSKATCWRALVSSRDSPSSKAEHSWSPSDRGSRSVSRPNTTRASR